MLRSLIRTQHRELAGHGPGAASGLQSSFPAAERVIGVPLRSHRMRIPTIHTQKFDTHPSEGATQRRTGSPVSRARVVQAPCTTHYCSAFSNVAEFTKLKLQNPTVLSPEIFMYQSQALNRDVESLCKAREARTDNNDSGWVWLQGVTPREDRCTSCTKISRNFDLCSHLVGFSSSTLMPRETCHLSRQQASGPARWSGKTALARCNRVRCV